MLATEELNLLAVKEACAAFSHNDIPALLKTLAEDVDWLVPGPQKIIPYAGLRKGRQQVAAFVTALHEAEEIEAFEPREFVARGNTVIVLGEYRALIRSTRRMVSLQWVQVYTLREGKIDRFREFFDTALAVQAYSEPLARVARSAAFGAQRRDWGARSF